MTQNAHSIHTIIRLLHVLWNHEPVLISSSGKQKRDSRLPGEINAIFWVIAEQDEQHYLFDMWETEGQEKWGKRAWQ
ncbi:hypothetical protein Erwinia_phage_Pastis_00095 [Erwinia phage Pastis]|nr:hypothetical protein Erwinia_phage_Pastis_00095 [Erwinia phage Pastis]